MEYFVQQLINGITLGSIYGLIAIGYTMVFGIIGMVNFAHGDVFMVSAFVALIAFLIVTTWLGISSIALALFIVLIVAMAVHFAYQLGDRARRLPPVARLVPAGAADLGHRHVDLPVQFRPGDAGTAQQVDPADGSGRVRSVQPERFSGHAVLQAAHHLERHRRTAAGVLVSGQQDAPRPGPARLRAGPENGGAASASTSTAPFR